MRKLFVIFAVVTAGCVGVVAGVSWYLDPLCFRCDRVEAVKHTLNLYYRLAQILLAHPQTQQIVVGTSHGGAFSEDWLVARTGLSTLNVSADGADTFTKVALIRAAREMTHLTSVLWPLDYFEFVDGIQNSRLTSCPALRRYVEKELGEWPLVGPLKRLLPYFDHNTLEAALSARNRSGSLAPHPRAPTPAMCAGAGTDTMTPQLARAVDAAYRIFGQNVLHRPILPAAWNLFVSEVDSLARAGIRVIIFIAPYHPAFRARFAREYPELVDKHRAWIARVTALERPGVKVVSFFDGFPDDSPGTRNWQDGDHYTCHPATEMLKRSGL